MSDAEPIAGPDLIDRWRSWANSYFDHLADGNQRAAARCRKHLSNLGLIVYRRPEAIVDPVPQPHADFSSQPA